MKVQCKKCGKTDCGRTWKLIKRDWLIIIVNRYVYSLCSNCKPLLWDIRNNYEKFETFIDDDIKDILNKQRILKSLEGKRYKTAN